jgi:Zn-dependent protease with chaperone function
MIGAMTEVNDEGRDDSGDGKKRRKLRTLTGLSVDEFRHPLDQRATAALKQVPGLDKLLAKVLEIGLERMLYVENIASNLRVTPKMFPRLHKSLVWATRILDLPEPEMYVTTDPVPNAWTFGHTKPFITLTTGLIDMMTDEEVFFVIGHELGHIKGGHVLYGTMARNIAAIIELLGEFTLGIGSLLGRGMLFALYEWYRCAELTSDRAGLLCVQDLEAARSTFMKLAAGTTRLVAEIDRDEFIRQVREYEDIDRSTLDRAYKLLLTIPRTHPFAMQRAKEMEVWFENGHAEVMARHA